MDDRFFAKYIQDEKTTIHVYFPVQNGKTIIHVCFLIQNEKTIIQQNYHPRDGLAKNLKLTCRYPPSSFSTADS